MYEILTLNAISPAAAAELDQNYRLTPESASPDAPATTSALSTPTPPRSATTSTIVTTRSPRA